MPIQSDELSTSVREAIAGDANRIAALCVQLGYEVPVAHIERLLKAPAPNRSIFVAVVPRAGVVGWIAVAQRDALLSTNRADVEGLVVEHEYRSHRIGERLLEAAEVWARRRKCTSVRLLSNVVRERAHNFYTRLGYSVLKSEYVFQKDLT